MDILVLIDRLDALVDESRSWPLSDQVRIDRELLFELLDRMRDAIPVELREAQWIAKERAEMLADARRQAERIVREGRERQARLVTGQEIYRQAQRGAEDIIDDARDTEREIALGAEDYVEEIMSTVESNLERICAAVRRSRARLRESDD